MMDKCADPNIGKLLHAFELNLLDENDRDRFEAHVLECECCCRELKSFAPRGALLINSRELKREIEKEIGSERCTLSVWRNLWPQKPLILRPAFLLLIVVILILPTVIGLQTLLNEETGDTIVPVQKIQLTTLRSNGDTSFEIDKNLDGIVVINCPEVKPGEEYLIEIVDSENEVLFVDSQYTDFDVFRNAEFLFPRDRMIPGNYSVIVSEYTKEGVTAVHRYDFFIR